MPDLESIIKPPPRWFTKLLSAPAGKSVSAHAVVKMWLSVDAAKSQVCKIIEGFKGHGYYLDSNGCVFKGDFT